MTDISLLKRDVFGEIRRETGHNAEVIVRDTAAAAPWLRSLGRLMLRREARALAYLEGIDGIPELLDAGDDRLVRRFVIGEPMHVARPTDPAYFAAAARLLRRLHAAGVVHNDLAKEPNLLVRTDGTPAIVDFQLAICQPKRGRLFRLLGYEDLRHLLKHKRTYCPQALTRREQRILANPGPGSRVWRATVKPVYLIVTRKLLGWEDREGAAERGGNH